ncbi:MAG: DUF488 family protein [Candidatus Colwellbacteria bacterium]|nr:DUF488 family protein [Candidatus Colwellbacteria bacterium]
MIYTSYFANVKRLPINIIPISVCGKAPEWFKGFEYRKLGPKYGFFQEWKRNHDNEFYTKHYKEEVLKYLTQWEVITELYMMTQYRDIALVCYESPDKFCHRHLIADWLNMILRYDKVKEWEAQLPLFDY